MRHCRTAWCDGRFELWEADARFAKTHSSLLHAVVHTERRRLTLDPFSSALTRITALARPKEGRFGIAGRAAGPDSPVPRDVDAASVAAEPTG